MQYYNKRENYEMDGKNLDEVDDEKDLGVIMQSDLKWKRQCTKAVKSANRVLGMITRSFSYSSKDIVLHVYKTLVRPHLEYSVQAWRLNRKKRANGRGSKECDKTGALYEKI
jgi:ribonucleases P/MRP protein subunit RPP40